MSGIPDFVGSLYAQIQSTKSGDTLNGTVVFSKPEVNTVGSKPQKTWRKEVMAAYADHLANTNLTSYTARPQSNGADLTEAIVEWKKQLQSSAVDFRTSSTRDKNIKVMPGVDDKRKGYKLSLVDMGDSSNGLSKVPDTVVDSGERLLLLTQASGPGESGHEFDGDGNDGQVLEDPESGHGDDDMLKQPTTERSIF